MYESITLSENAAYHMQVSSTISQLRKYNHNYSMIYVHAYFAMHAITNTILVSLPCYCKHLKYQVDQLDVTFQVQVAAQENTNTQASILSKHPTCCNSIESVKI